MTLLGPNGEPISSDFAKAKVKSKTSPKIGELAVYNDEFGSNRINSLPMDNTLQFNTDRLTLADYRMMRNHYQINSSLSVLTFMIHQAQWTIECKNKKIADHVEMNMRRIWTRLIRAISQSFWAGYSPNALQWENDDHEGKVMLTKIKDLSPEDCTPKWKSVDAVSGKSTIADDPYGVMKAEPGTPGTGSRRKAKIFDGIRYRGFEDIPVENSLWHILLQEEGSMYGKKLLNAAFQPWFFSLLVHMYANRYFERFGEPTIVARAPYDDTIEVGGQQVQGNVLMQHFARMLRSGAVPVLPNTMQQSGIGTDAKHYDFDMSYLESQMRGADFERYIARLDQEISLAMFTPVLMTQTGDGGSFNLGITHYSIYQHQLNAIISDVKEYIDRYIIKPMALYNFGEKHDNVEISFRRFGGTDPETVRMIVNTMVGGGKLKLSDIEEIGQVLGMRVEEVEEVTEPPVDPDNPDNPDESNLRPGDPNYDPAKDPNNPAATPSDDNINPKKDTRQGRPERTSRPKGPDKKGKVSSGMAARLAQQLEAGNDADLGFKAKYANWVNDNIYGGFGDTSLINSNYSVLARAVDTAFTTAREVGMNRDEATDFFESSIDRHLDSLEKA